MTAVVVVATIRPLPEHRGEVIAAMEKVIADVHAHDDGCLLYALNEGDDRLVMVEKWASPAALDEHSRGPALAQLNQALSGRLEAGLDVQILRPHSGGRARSGHRLTVRLSRHPRCPGSCTAASPTTPPTAKPPAWAHRASTHLTEAA
jgi:quinol monooxygenase YgiN